MNKIVKVLGLIVKLPFDLIIGIITGIIKLIEYFAKKGQEEETEIKTRYRNPKKLK